jgi:hypothetical protein
MCARTLALYRELLADLPVAHPGTPTGTGGQVAA